MSFDPSFEPEKFVASIGKNSSKVYGPADLTDGACFGREVICQCLSWHHAANATLISHLLNERAQGMAEDK